jgi:uncharacterized protein DUF397
MTHNTTFTHWRKSSRSSGGDNCVEIASATCGDAVGVRDSKQAGRGPVLEFTSGEWAGFVAGAKTGEFDLR